MHGPAYRFNTYIVCFGVNQREDEKQSNLVFVYQTEMPTVRAPACFRSFRFNTYIVCFGVSGREMETCCFEFDRMRREVSNGLFLFHGSFYLLLACFTYLSPLPEVDKIHSTLVLYICSRFGCKTYVTPTQFQFMLEYW